MLLIYLPAITPRCGYIFDMVFKEEFGIDYRFTTDMETFKRHENHKINYSFNPTDDTFFIHAFPLLFEQGIKKIDVFPTERFGTTILFANDASCMLGFDIFSAAFYMISRYEEYLPFAPDKHGRYEFSDCLAHKNRFLQKPVVNTWIDIFRKKLSQKFPALQFKPTSFNHVFTIDIDIAYAFKGRNISRFTGATIKDLIYLRFKKIFDRVRSFTGLQKDPWDVYDILYETIVKYNLNSIFFFLLADYSKYDKNISPAHPAMKELVKRITSFSQVGIHPSFTTSATPGKISVEKERLEKISGQKINKSRQHYLKFTLPGTYNQLISAGIEEDYSMGFAGMPGFRAGTCKPFYFYDLTNEKPTRLKIFPITVMEGTFIDYLRSSPAEALDHIFELIGEVANVKGTFISIWHNHTLSETGMYKGWRYVHHKMIERLLSYT